MLHAQNLPLVFNEEFNDNELKWLTTDNVDVKIEVAYGKYIMQKKPGSNGAYTSFYYSNVNGTTDFEVSASIKHSFSGNYSAFGLLWGVKDVSNFYSFLLTNEGKFVVDKCTDSKYTFLKAPEYNAAVRQGNNAVNVLKISKKGNDLSFYVNDVFIYKTSAMAFFGSGFGFYVDGNQTIEADYIKISAQRKDQYTIDMANVSKTPYLNENFNDNKSSWKFINDATQVTSISDGYYHFNKKSSTGYSYTALMYPLTNDKNFEFELAAKKISGSTENGYGIIWFDNITKSYYNFTVAATGYYRVLKFNETSTTKIKDWTICDEVNMGSGVTNKLNVVRKGTEIKFYVNNAMVYSTTYVPIDITHVGLVVYWDQWIDFDSIKFYKL